MAGIQEASTQVPKVSSTCRLIRSLRVAVEGNIGSGKSTLLNYCNRFVDIEVVPEPVSAWQNVGGTNLLVIAILNFSV